MCSLFLLYLPGSCYQPLNLATFPASQVEGISLIRFPLPRLQGTKRMEEVIPLPFLRYVKSMKHLKSVSKICVSSSIILQLFFFIFLLFTSLIFALDVRTTYTTGWWYDFLFMWCSLEHSVHWLQFIIRLFWLVGEL